MTDIDSRIEGPKSFRRRPKLSVPVKAHPLVRKLYDHMQCHNLGVVEMAELSGVNKNTLKDWRTRTVPKVDNLEACFNVMDLTLRPVKAVRRT